MGEKSPKLPTILPNLGYITKFGDKIKLPKPLSFLGYIRFDIMLNKRTCKVAFLQNICSPAIDVQSICHELCCNFTIKKGNIYQYTKLLTICISLKQLILKTINVKQITSLIFFLLQMEFIATSYNKRKIYIILIICA